MSVRNLTIACLALSAAAALTLIVLGASYSTAIKGYPAAIVISSLFTAASGIFTALFVTLKILIPLKRLGRAVEGMSAGDHKSRLAVKSLSGADDEVGRLAGKYLSLHNTLRESIAHYRDLTGTLPDAVIELDREGHVRRLNEAAVRLTGYRKGDLLGMPFDGLVAAEAAESAREAVSSIARGSRMRNLKLPLTFKDGTVNFFEFNAAPVWNGGDVIGCRLVGRDIEEQKKIMDELKNARAEAAETSEKLNKTIKDLEEFALLAVRREIKMREIRERLQNMREAKEERQKHAR